MTGTVWYFEIHRHNKIPCAARIDLHLKSGFEAHEDLVACCEDA